MYTNVYEIKKNREIILKRREQVKTLHFIQNYSIVKIAELLNWNPQTIFRDIEKLRKEFEKQIIIVDVNEIWKKIWLNRTEVLQKLWKNVLKAGKEGNLNAERKGLMAIDDIRQKDISTLQELGFIQKPKDRMEVSEPKDIVFEIIRPKDAKRITNKKRRKKKI